MTILAWVSIRRTYARTGTQVVYLENDQKARLREWGERGRKGGKAV
jgi:hypothetical protein